MKLIDADKLKAEIERLKSKYRHNGLWLSSTQSMLAGAKIEAMNELLPFLDSLQQEQQEEPDKSLEEAADKHIRKVVDAAGHPGWDWETHDITEAFKAGAKWQKEQDTRDMFMSDNRHFNKVYELGKKDMKEQMLKDAVEGYVGMHLTDKGTKVTVNSGYLPEEMGIRSDSKVRIIIVREGEK